MAMKRGVSSTRDPALRRLKLMQTIQYVMKGFSQKEIAALMGVTEQTIDNWKTEAKKKGIVEEVRQRLENEMLPKAANVYEAILDASADDLTKKGTVKAHELKLKAARDIAHGLGALRKDAGTVKATKTTDLEGYYALRAARHVVNRPISAEEAKQLGRRESIDAPSPSGEGVIEGEILGENADGTNRERGLSAEDAEDPRKEGERGFLGHNRWNRGQGVDRPDGAGDDPGGEEGGGRTFPGEGTDIDSAVDEGRDGEGE